MTTGILLKVVRRTDGRSYRHGLAGGFEESTVFPTATGDVPATVTSSGTSKYQHQLWHRVSSIQDVISAVPNDPQFATDAINVVAEANNGGGVVRQTQGAGPYHGVLGSDTLGAMGPSFWTPWQTACPVWLIAEASSAVLFDESNRPSRPGLSSAWFSSTRVVWSSRSLVDAEAIVSDLNTAHTALDTALSNYSAAIASGPVAQHHTTYALAYAAWSEWRTQAAAYYQALMDGGVYELGLRWSA